MKNYLLDAASNGYVIMYCYYYAIGCITIIADPHTDRLNSISIMYVPKWAIYTVAVWCWPYAVYRAVQQLLAGTNFSDQN